MLFPLLSQSERAELAEQRRKGTFPSPEGKQCRGCEIRAGVETSMETSSVVQRLGEVLWAAGLWVEEPRIIVILAFPLRGQVPKSL